MSAETSNSINPWPHRLAVLLVCATFPLIWVGGLVTTTQAGMAVPDWPSTFGYNLFLYPWTTWLFGPWDLFIEHGHRLFGSLVGLITIALAVSLWRSEARRWVRMLGLIAVPAVIGQGVLGGMRVLLNERTLAQIHACTGPAFFALSVALAVVTFRWWSTVTPQEQIADKSLVRLAVITTVLSYGQLLLGSQIRHVDPGTGSQSFQTAVYFHLFMAAVLALHVFFLAARVLVGYRKNRRLARPAVGLLLCLVLQLALGCATWVVKYGWPAGLGLADLAWTSGYTVTAGGLWQSIVVTAHVATGSLILASALVLSLRSARVC